MTRARTAHAGALICTACVCLFLLLPGDASPSPSLWALPDGIDKLFHAVLFFIETHYLLLSFRHLRLGLPPLAAAILAAGILGALTEMAQLGIPRRSAEGADLLADVAGACAYGVWSCRPRRTARNRT